MLLVQEHILQLRGGVVSGKVKTSEEAYSLMGKYKNLYNMPEKMQKEFTDSFAQAVIDTYNRKMGAAEEELLEKTKQAFATQNEGLYKNAMSWYNTLRKNAVEERDIVTDKYNKFIKVK